LKFGIFLTQRRKGAEAGNKNTSRHAGSRFRRMERLVDWGLKIGGPLSSSRIPHPVSSWHPRDPWLTSSPLRVLCAFCAFSWLLFHGFFIRVHRCVLQAPLFVSYFDLARDQPSRKRYGLARKAHDEGPASRIPNLASRIIFPSVLIRVIRGQILLLSVSSVVKLLPLTISQVPFSIRAIRGQKRIRLMIVGESFSMPATKTVDGPARE